MRLSKWIVMVALMAVGCWAFGAGKGGGKGGSGGSGKKGSSAPSSKGSSSSNSHSGDKDSGDKDSGDKGSGDKGSGDKGSGDKDDVDAEETDVDAEETDCGKSPSQASHGSRGKGFSVVEAVDEGAITVTGKNGKSRTVQIPKEASIEDLVQCEPSNLETGAAIRAWGIINEDGTFTAAQAVSGSGKLQKLGPKGSGLEAVSGTVEGTDPLTIKDDEGNLVEVSLSESSVIQITQSISLSDIRPGDSLVISAGNNSSAVTRVSSDNTEP